MTTIYAKREKEGKSDSRLGVGVIIEWWYDMMGYGSRVAECFGVILVYGNGDYYDEGFNTETGRVLL